MTDATDYVGRMSMYAGPAHRAALLSLPPSVSLSVSLSVCVSVCVSGLCLCVCSCGGSVDVWSVECRVSSVVMQASSGGRCVSLSLCVRVCVYVPASLGGGVRRWRCCVLQRGRAVGSLQGRPEVLAAVAVRTAGSEGTIEAEAAERQREKGADHREMMRGEQRSEAGAGGADMGR